MRCTTTRAVSGDIASLTTPEIAHMLLIRARCDDEKTGGATWERPPDCIEESLERLITIQPEVQHGVRHEQSFDLHTCHIKMRLLKSRQQRLSRKHVDVVRRAKNRALKDVVSQNPECRPLVRDTDDQQASWTQHSVEFGKRALVFRHMLEHLIADHHVERAIATRQVRDRSPHYSRDGQLTCPSHAQRA